MIDKSSMMLAQLGFSQNTRVEDLVVQHNVRRRDHRDRLFRLDYASRLDRLPPDSSIDSPVSTNRKSQRIDRPSHCPAWPGGYQLPLRSPQSPLSPEFISSAYQSEVAMAAVREVRFKIVNRKDATVSWLR